MMKHHVTEHPTVRDPIDFSMKVLKTHRTPFERQIHEAVLIQIHEKDGILNSKAEFNRCQLPRLSVMMGVKEVVKDQESEMTQEEEEDSMKKDKRKNDMIMDLTEEMCPPPNKKKKVWRKEIPKRRKRKKDEVTEAEEGEASADEKSLPTGRKSMKYSKMKNCQMDGGRDGCRTEQNCKESEEFLVQKINSNISDNKDIPAGWRRSTGQQDGRRNDEEEVSVALKHQQPKKIHKIIDYFDKLNENEETLLVKKPIIETNFKINSKIKFSNFCC